MAVITLITDWGTKDSYVAALKGSLLQECTQATIVDVSHSVNKFNILQGAIILKNCYSQFPPGTVHLVAMKSQDESEALPIAIKHQGQYFVGLNDGFFSLAFDDMPSEIIFLEASGATSSSFDIQAIIKGAGFLANGGNFANLGAKAESFVTKTQLQPVTESNLLKGTVIYVDDFENAITNISKELFEKMCNGRRFEIFVRGGEYYIEDISEKYGSKKRGDLIALFNSSGLLEISLNQGNAAGLLGLDYGDIIRIEFK